MNKKFETGIITVALLIGFIVGVGAILRACEATEKSFQACVTATQKPLECKAGMMR